jgi:PIN domain nuclease of toxin-antitoxin system
MIFLDTHVVIWLYTKELSRFSDRGIQALEEEVLNYSPMVMMELHLLHEIGRINIEPKVILHYLEHAIGLEPDPLSLLPIAETACFITWTSDPFDRMIASHANYRKGKLLTRDGTMLENCRYTFW